MCSSDLQLFPAANPPALPALDENASTVALTNFARFELAPASGNAKFSPRRSLGWRTRDGEAWLQQTYSLDGFPGGGSRNVSGIHLSVIVR